MRWWFRKLRMGPRCQDVESSGEMVRCLQRCAQAAEVAALRLLELRRDVQQIGELFIKDANLRIAERENVELRRKIEQEKAEASERAAVKERLDAELERRRKGFEFTPPPPKLDTEDPQ